MGVEGGEETVRVRYKTRERIWEAFERWVSEGEMKNVKFCHTRTRTQNVFSCVNHL